jgi:hypothetical protein
LLNMLFEDNFVDYISYDDYQTMLLHVMSSECK